VVVRIEGVCYAGLAVIRVIAEGQLEAAAVVRPVRRRDG
jgi:hypothetical protein